MGYGMPAAMGAQVACPSRQVVCIAGDASILMNIQELGTIAAYNLPVKVVIVNNQWQGMVRQWQESFYDERYSSSDMLRGMPDFIALAKAFGVNGVKITERGSLHQDLEAALNSPEPMLIDVHVRRGEIVIRWFHRARATPRWWVCLLSTSRRLTPHGTLQSAVPSRPK